MNTSNNILFAALLTAILSPSSPLHAQFFDLDALEEHFDQQIEHMHQSMQHMRKHYKHDSVALSAQAIALDIKDKNVIITIAHMEMDNVEARLNDANNQLTITTPTKKFVIATRGNSIAIEGQETIHQKSKNDTKDTMTQFSGTSMYRTESYVHGKLSLEKQTTDYNPDKKELMVTIPFEEISKGKVVPINTLPSQPNKIVAQENNNKEAMPLEK